MSTNKSSDSKTKSIYDYVKKEKKEEDLIFENFDTEFQNLKRKQKSFSIFKRSSLNNKNNKSNEVMMKSELLTRSSSFEVHDTDEGCTVEKVLEEIELENGKKPFSEIKIDTNNSDLPPPIPILETKHDSSGCIKSAKVEDTSKKCFSTLKQSNIIDQFCKLQSTNDKEISKAQKRKRDLEDEECIVNKKTVM